MRLTRIRELRRRAEPPVVQEAWEALSRLRYLETTTQEWNSELRAANVRVGGKVGVSRAAQRVTTLELTDGYSDLLKLAARDRTVVVGIDELDKMASAEEVERFLNGIKAVFGGRGVFYLVTVSDDALRAFEQRGLPIRDAFESVFDEVLSVEPLELESSMEVLRRRIVGFPPPFGVLCHALSGGLPRELIRCAREVAFAHEAAEALADIAVARVAQRGIRRERAAAVVARRAVATDGSQPLLTWLREKPPVRTLDDAFDRTDIGSLLSRIRNSALDENEIEALSMTALELAASWYHGATVIEFFSSVTEQKLTNACKLPVDGGKAKIEALACAALDLGIAPGLAWETINAFRQSIGLTEHEYPRLATVP
jgi:hypothetical protein